MQRSLIFIFLIFIAFGCGSSGSSSVTYSWQINVWGECTDKTQDRTVYCISSDRKTVEDSNCSGTKPTTIQICSTLEITNDVGMKFVPVTRGSFQMGSNDEAPIHTVNITNDFYVGRYEVTQGEWETVMGSNPSSHTSCAKCPVEKVSWNDVQTFITKLNGKEVTDKYRLLTEAEWEYVARGGTKSNSYTYSGSNTINDFAWYATNSGGVTHTVGTKSPNELGVYDMSGNVYEWVQDYYSDSFYSNSPADNPVNTTSGSDFVIRGGSISDSENSCYVVSRGYDSPINTNINVGFRIAKSL